MKLYSLAQVKWYSRAHSRLAETEKISEFISNDGPSGSGIFIVFFRISSWPQRIIQFDCWLLDTLVSFFGNFRTHAHIHSRPWQRRRHRRRHIKENKQQPATAIERSKARASKSVNRICAFGTWWETGMFIVNIRHNVIGHIICLRAIVYYVVLVVVVYRIHVPLKLLYRQEREVARKIARKS